MESKLNHKAMTAAERQRKRRQKMKDEGTYEEYKKKHLEEVKKSRKKQKEVLMKLPKSTQNKIMADKRLATRNRVAAFRAKKKNESKTTLKDNLISDTNYSRSALGKATARGRRNLPFSPRKKNAVIRRLYFLDVCQNTTPSQASEMSSSSTSSSNGTVYSSTISAETVELVQNFYQRDDISRQAPGRKDSITVRQNNCKSKVQVRHLLNSITETFKLFQEDYPETKIGRSKFAELRPKHVLTSNKLPHNVCLCKYHENFIGALFHLHQAFPEVFPTYSNVFPQTIICETPKEDCWYNNCEECKDGLGFQKKYIENSIIDKLMYVKWYEWKSEGKEHIQKVLQEGTIEELILHISKLIPTFLEHCYIKRHQAQEYQKLHNLVASNDLQKIGSTYSKIALIQVDFAENYTCKYQDEIQSAHWQQSQVSLFTVAIWHSGMLYPCVLASDNTTHSKETVIAYIDKILEDLPKDLVEVNIWSDGPSSQFKNRFIAAALCVLQKKYNFLLNWNFFATSHGKGPVDGIGGSVKRQVWGAVSKRQHIVVNAKSFVEAANIASKVKVLEVTSEEIEKRNKSLQLERVFNTAQSISNISKVHQLVVTNGDLVTRKLSNKISLEQVPKVGDWYFVEYQGKLYPGEIKATDSKEYKVQTMEAIGKHWKWPNKTDIIFYTNDKLIKKLDHPIVVNSRGHFKFE